MQSRRLWFTADGYYTRFTSGTWTTQIGSRFATVFPFGSRAAVGLQGEGQLSYLEGDVWSGAVALGPIGAISASGWLATAGATAGGVRRVDETSDPVFAGALGLSRLAGPWNIDARLHGTAAGDIVFLDVGLSAAYRTAIVELGVSAGHRVGDLADDPWAQGSAAWHVLPLATLELSLGFYPKDITGFTSGFFVSGGIRIGRPAPPTVRALRESAVVVESLGPDRTRITFTVGAAAQVAIAGEWNDWTPIPLSQIDGRQWRIELPLGPGLYRFSLVIDGERWMVPHGVATLPDDFGGEVGLLVIGAR
jgi:hypothetical protein